MSLRIVSMHDQCPRFVGPTTCEYVQYINELSLFFFKCVRNYALYNIRCHHYLYIIGLDLDFVWAKLKKISFFNF